MRSRVTDVVCYSIGSLCFAMSVSVFSEPYNIAPGGAAGLGIIAHELVGIPVGAVILLLNIPLLLAAWRVLGRAYACRSTAVIVLSSVMMDVFAPLLPAFRGERLLAALCAGLLSGVGIGLIMLRGAGTGGSDIAAALLRRKRPHWSLGRMIMAVDAVIIALSVPVFGELAAALYAAIQVFVSSVLIDRIVYGREEGRLLLVVSRQAPILCQAITTQLSRGVTVLRATGGYTGADTSLLLCAVDRTQLVPLRILVRELDPTAFVMVVVTEQVVGEGFLQTGSG